jgi:hypothetical protein
MDRWRLPTPHEVFFTIVAVAVVLSGLHVFHVGSVGETIVNITMGVAGLLGIPVAARHLPDHVKEVLAENDARIKSALAATNPGGVPIPPETPKDA